MKPTPVNIRQLTAAATIRLVNSTPLGTVATAASLRRHRDAAGMRIAAAGSDRHIDFLRLVAWLVDRFEELDRPAGSEAADRYIAARKKQAERNRAAVRAAQDIAPIPQIADVERRKAAGDAFRVFCETYCGRAFWRAWSGDHLRVIAKIERAVREGGLFAFAMPRGSGKTALAWHAALWAVLHGYRPFVCLIGGEERKARELLRSIRLAILENPLLAADYPEAIYPFRRLENSSKRQLQQHCHGQLTHLHWGTDRIVFPTLVGEDLPAALRDAGLTASPSGGAIISATSLDANIRGQQHGRPDGSILRPSLVILDDPQTRGSARSADQTAKRLEMLHGDVLGMAGPGEAISALITCTKVYEGDLADTILDADKSPEWEGECTKLMPAMPTDEKLWAAYAERRRTKGRKAATAFYRRNRKAMDAGAEAAWRERFDRASGEISAIQHAMNLKLKVGPEAFGAEYQNEPTQIQSTAFAITVDQVCAKFNGLARGRVPPTATRLTAFIDLHDRLHYWCVCAWDEDFSGAVIDYGTEPEQHRSRFTLADAPRTLRKAFPGAGPDGALHAGLERLVTGLLGRDFHRGGAIMRIDRLLVDAGYKPAIVAAVKRKAGAATMTAAKGVGIRASRKPMAAYTRRPGERLGDHWYEPNVRQTHQFPHVLLDTNYWKSLVHDGMATAMSDRGCIGLYGTAKTNHTLFAEHISRSERWVEVTGPYGRVREWIVLPTKPDNHWLDCLAGCAAAASMCGIQTPGEPTPIRQRKRYTQADLRR